jgi:hypothetical protein
MHCRIGLCVGIASDWPGGDGRIEGLVLRLTEPDLAKADAYETAAYARTQVTLVSGRRAFVYVAADI